MTPKEIAVKVAWSLYGTPYRWTGDDPMAGFDCSGFVIEVLKSAGRLPGPGDWTAKQLYPMFKAVQDPTEGCLVFWGKTADGIYHVEFCLDETFSIGASGGDEKTITEADAIKSNAYIKVRPFRNRPGIFGFNDPFL